MRDLGKMGERTFASLCSAAGLTANPSLVDKTGWDYLIEFPVTYEPEQPADLVAAALECRIQVKATDKGRKKWDISLRNLERLVKSHMPAFVCILDFDGEDFPQEVYLIHIGEKIMRHTLQRLRKQAEVGRKNTKSPTMTIARKDSDKLQRSNGTCLKQAIEAHIPEGFEKYHAWKKKLLDTLGYEHGHGYVNFQFASSDPIGDLIDLSLGLKKSLKTENVSMHDTRFKVDKILPGFPKAGGELSLSPNPIKGAVCFKDRKSSPAIEFPASVHIPSVNRVVPEERVKFRIQTHFFDLIIQPFKKEGRFSLLPDVEQASVGLFALRDFLKFLCMSSVQGKDGMWMYVTVDERILLPEGKMLVPEISAPIEELDTIEYALKIAIVYGIQDKVSISLTHLVELRKKIADYYNAVENEKEQLTATFYTHDHLEIKDTSGVILHACLSLGDWVVYCVFGLIGRLEQIGEKQYKLTSCEKGLHKRVVSQNREIDYAELTELAAEIEQEMETRNIDPIIVIPANGQNYNKTD